MVQKTKAHLAQTFKALIAEKPLDQITVTEVAARSGINRQTFYYHFRDLYELIGWIYQTEALEAVEGYVSCADWQQGMRRFLAYIQENRIFCLQTYQAVDRRHFEDFVFAFAQKLLGEVMAEVAADMPLAPEADQKLLVYFYGCVLVGLVKQWLENGAEEDPDILTGQLSAILEGHFAQGLQRLLSNRSHGMLY